MKFDPEKHHRHSIRLQGYDYAQAGAYFITVVTQGRECLFGQVVNGEMRLNDAGRIAQDEWLRTAVIRPRVTLDAFVIMPNHIHGIIVLSDVGRGTLQRAPTDDAPSHHTPSHHSPSHHAPSHHSPTHHSPSYHSPSYHSPSHHAPAHHTPSHQGTSQPAPTDDAPTVEQFGKPTSDSIPTIIRLFKSATTKRINEMRDAPGVLVWQRNYYEHIIRDDGSLHRIRRYIVDNPAQWANDDENPEKGRR